MAILTPLFTIQIFFIENFVIAPLDAIISTMDGIRQKITIPLDALGIDNECATTTRRLRKALKFLLDILDAPLRFLKFVKETAERYVKFLETILEDLEGCVDVCDYINDYIDNQIDKI